MKSVRPTIAFLLLVTSAGLAGCGGSPEKKLIGKWEVDTEALKEAMKAEAGDDPAAAMGMAMMDSMKMNFEFKEEDVMAINISMGGMNMSMDGKWEVASSSGKSLTIKTETKNPQSDTTETEEMSITFVDDDTIEMKPPKSSNMKVDKVTLRRVKE